MPGEEQERFEDYLELERFIAEVQAGHTAYPPQELTPTQAHVYRMALFFHAATPGASEPDVDFAARLQTRLEQEVQELATHPVPPIPVVEPVPLIQRTASRLKQRLPRRWLLAGSASTAASLLVGAGMMHAVDMRASNGGGPEVKVTTANLTQWFRVTTLAEMGNQAVKFKVEAPNGSLSLTGYVLRSDQNSNNSAEGSAIREGDVIAISAACTHMGCIVEWSGSDRKFHCPCHGGVFNGIGGTDQTSEQLYLERLPLLDVQIRESTGEIFVRMPASP